MVRNPPKPGEIWQPKGMTKYRVEILQVAKGRHPVVLVRIQGEEVWLNVPWFLDNYELSEAA